MKSPTEEQLRVIANSFGLVLSNSEIAELAKLSASMQPAYECLEKHASPELSAVYKRDRGWEPQVESNPYNAWAWRSDIRGAPDGPLKGCKVGIKDNIAVAGLPMRNGSALLEGFVPEGDATVVTRILDAGGTIVGKTVCEDLCFSGGSHTSRPRPVVNPYDRTRSAGGSSSGNAVAIAAGDVTMCVGGDQGGSVRTPASWCGIVGLKPTYGLVPYTGAFPIEPSFDHLGPMGREVGDVALLLSIIAGSDGLDPRQANIAPQNYIEATNEPAKGLRIGVLREGFGRSESDPESDKVVLRALAMLSKAGAQVEDITIPWHIDAYQVGSVAIFEGAANFLFTQNAMGWGSQGHYLEKLSAYWADAWPKNPDRLADIGKFALIFGSYMQENYRGHYYAKAQNLRRNLRKAYDEALGACDVLAMPTMPFTATPLPPPDAGLETRVIAGLNMEGNTAPFDASGHPAITVPCGSLRGLPVGLMFVGRHYDERNVLRAAACFEKLGDWRTY